MAKTWHLLLIDFWIIKKKKKDCLPLAYESLI